MKEYKNLLMGAAIILLVTITLSACSNSNPEENDVSVEAEVDEASVELASEQEININLSQEPPSLNPGIATDTTSGSVLIQIFEGLTRVGPDGEIQEAMASDIDISEDGTVYTFTIRDDAKWSNGDPVTAEDFEFAWKWALNPDNADANYAHLLYSIKNGEQAKAGEVPPGEIGIEVLDEKVLEVTLERPTQYFLDLTAYHTLYPVNKNVVENKDKWFLDAGDQYTTNGPFKLSKWEHDNEIVLIKNEEYWDSENVNLDKITFVMVNDESTELNMFNSGELDWAGHPTGKIPLSSIDSLKEEEVLVTEPKEAVYYYAMNVEEEPIDNKNIRKALSLAIDREGIVNNITKTGELPAMAFVAPPIWSENKKGYFEDNDVEKAKEYLELGMKEKGYNTIEDMPPITLSYNTSEEHAQIAQAIQDMWKENLDLDVELDNNDWQVYLDKLGSGDYQVGRFGWVGLISDPVNFLEIFQEKGGANRTNWVNQEYTDLIRQSRDQVDPDKRKDTLKSAEQILMDEMPVAPIYFYSNIYAHQDYLHDAYVSSLGTIQFKWAYVTEK
ncbi:peptide ABC transporter substrate-binding protein [Virgibacillus byunsanensis]|uniref:Peptide ABC transporter substrate-binding protein n=1 Tax=Virgibacillus byunsanensis TaxID=570945 RepID=A0ABW3LIF6_9BACI